MSDGKVLRDETTYHARTPARRWRQPSQDRKRLEGRMAARPRVLLPTASTTARILLAVRDNERNGDAVIDQGFVFGNPPRLAAVGVAWRLDEHISVSEKRMPKAPIGLLGRVVDRDHPHCCPVRTQLHAKTDNVPSMKKWRPSDRRRPRLATRTTTDAHADSQRWMFLNWPAALPASVQMEHRPGCCAQAQQVGEMCRR